MNAPRAFLSTAAAIAPHSAAASTDAVSAAVDPRPLRLILFDFDGTLADSFQAVVAIVDRLAPKFGYPRLTPDVISRFRDFSSREVLQNSDIAGWQRLWLLYCVKRELKANLHQLRPIQGIEETLRGLRAAGYSLGIVTSNRRSTVQAFLSLMGWQDYFSWIEASHRIFSKDRAIARLRRRLHLTGNAVAYVGDETRDVEAARRAGVVSISVVWGFNSERALRGSQPDLLIHHPQELLHWLGGDRAVSGEPSVPAQPSDQVRSQPQTSG